MKWQRACKWIEVVTYGNSLTLRKVVLSLILASDNVRWTRHPLTDYCDFVQQKHPLESLFMNCDRPQVTHLYLVTFDLGLLRYYLSFFYQKSSWLSYCVRWLIRRCSLVRVLSPSVTFCQYRSPRTISVNSLILLSVYLIGKCLKVTINVFLYYHFYTKRSRRSTLVFLNWRGLPAWGQSRTMMQVTSWWWRHVYVIVRTLLHLMSCYGRDLP